MDHRQWRTGRKVGRTLYAMLGDEPSDVDVLIGMLDTPALAEDAAQGHNIRLALAIMADGNEDLFRAGAEPEPKTRIEPLAHLTNGRDHDGTEWTLCGLPVTWTHEQTNQAAHAGNWCPVCRTLDA